MNFYYLFRSRQFPSFWNRVVLVGLLSAATAAATQVASRKELVRPSLADANVHEFDEDNVVLMPQAGGNVPLVLFLPGTHGRPGNAMSLLNVVAGQGYRVIGLSYNDDPAAVQICPRNPNPNCFAQFRAMRTFGQGPAPVNNSYNESIEGRLVALLRYLDHEHPNERWSQYLEGTGHPLWPQIVVSGLSQGAGMAAYIAKLHPVCRVVLFSSPWDFVGRRRRPAPWLSGASATPLDRWWAERHVRENTTELIANAYRALRIPSDHVLLFDQGIAQETRPENKNPYHPSTIRNAAYEPQWRELFGSPQSP